MVSPFRRSERDPLWRREMRERWRRPITLFFVSLYVVGLCWFAYSLYSALVPAGSIEMGTQSRGIGHQIFVSLMGLQIGIWIPVALMLAAPTIAAERERRAFIEYMLAGLLPRQIVRAKFASIATFITVMCAVPLPVLSLCFPLGGVEPMELIAGVIFEIAVAITCASVGLFISVNNRRVASAMQFAIFVSLVFLFLAAMIVPGMLEATFWIWLVFAGLLALATGVVIVGCEDCLNSISRHLEQEERGGELPPPVYWTPSPAQPIRPVQPLPAAPTPPPTPTPSSRILNEELLENSSWDIWIEKIAVFNPIALREVRVGLRASRIRMALSPDTPSYQMSPIIWAAIGVVGALFISLTQMPVWWSIGLIFTSIGAAISVTSGASAAFTHEREQKMLSQLQMCPLSSFEIVVGKIGAMMLLLARSWGGPLLALFIVGLSQGLPVALETAVVVSLSLLFAVTIAILLSLLCHHTPIATGGTLGALLVAFVLLPISPDSLSYYVPTVRTLTESFLLGNMWVEPLRVLLLPTSSYLAGGMESAEALLRVGISLIVLNTLLIGAITIVWSKTSPDDGDAKTRFWERDISRSWR
ncbi:hypothetical protein EON83_05475 [bacterium]|nr:MAG: hypothetical protein EON83_05475 [bacterium]